MDEVDAQPRSVVAYDLARRLIYHTAAVDLSMSPVRSAQMRLDILLRAKRISPEEHSALSALLCTVEGCDADVCHAGDELVIELTRQVTTHINNFPDERLAELVTRV